MGHMLCRFVDPTNDVTGLSKYKKALTILFDPAQSEVQFKGIRISGPDTIEADWTLGGTLKLPWRPRIQTIDGHTVSELASGFDEIKDLEAIFNNQQH